ncbi:hypothetical protein GY45DRAFT_1125679 [Cubamyces sp. BRFM 1775]|nr:hypothetical protein GY45DRAFT_1125679 [Cubamyces sp. BRFM 1775]
MSLALKSRLYGENEPSTVAASFKHGCDIIPYLRVAEMSRLCLASTIPIPARHLLTYSPVYSPPASVQVSSPSTPPTCPRGYTSYATKIHPIILRHHLWQRYFAVPSCDQSSRLHPPQCRSAVDAWKPSPALNMPCALSDGQPCGSHLHIQRYLTTCCYCLPCTGLRGEEQLHTPSRATADPDAQ